MILNNTVPTAGRCITFDLLEVARKHFVSDSTAFWQWLNDVAAETSNHLLAKTVEEYFLRILGHCPTFPVLILDPKDAMIKAVRERSCVHTATDGPAAPTLRVGHQLTGEVKFQVPLSAWVDRLVDRTRSRCVVNEHGMLSLATNGDVVSPEELPIITIDQLIAKSGSVKDALAALDKLLELGGQPEDAGRLEDPIEEAKQVSTDHGFDKAVVGMSLESLRESLLSLTFRGVRVGTLKRHLSAPSAVTRNALELMFSLMPRFSTTLHLRAKMRKKILIEWLAGRRDLLPVVDMMVDASFLGWFTFASTAGTMCCLGPMPIFIDMSDHMTLRSCHKCCATTLKPFKLALRQNTGNSKCCYEDAASFQYIDHLLGRYDHPCFVDTEDVQTRLNYDDLRVRNVFYGRTQELEQQVSDEVFRMGELFGKCIVNNPKYLAGGLKHASTIALTEVPQGSIAGSDIPESAGEMPKEDVTKKIAFGYMTKEEEDHMCRTEACHSWSSVAPKLEVAKMRNLVPGTTVLYALSSRLSAYGEDTFLASIPEVPLMSGEQVRQQRMNRLMECSELGYATARDYLNFNIRYKHQEEIIRFYKGVRTYAKARQAWDVVDDVDRIITCISDMGVIYDGVKYVWKYGLMTGWRHTMLFHCVMNTVLARVVKGAVSKLIRAHVLASQHQGDDSAEMWSHPLAGPLAQAILDAMGSAGKAEKQHFSSYKGGWFEFCRVNYYSGAACASALRGLSGLWGGDSQHPVLKGSPAMGASLIEDINTISRRHGKPLLLRFEDLETLLAYWATPPALLKRGYRSHWAIPFVSTTCGGLGVRSLLFPDLRLDSTVRVISIVDKPPFESNVLPRLVARKLPELSPLNLSPYAREYSEEFMVSTGLRERVYVPQSTIPPVTEWASYQVSIPGDSAESREAEHIARSVVDYARKGVYVNLPPDQTAEDAAVGSLFAGSRRVALAYIKAKLPLNFLRGRDSYSNMIDRGLSLLTRKGPKAEVFDPAPSFFPSEWVLYLRSWWQVLTNRPALEVAVNNFLLRSGLIWTVRI